MDETGTEAASIWPSVQSVWHQVEVDSTNDQARQLIQAGTIGPLPALVWADWQTRGRGQGANTWWSDEGSLTASIVLDPLEYSLGVAVRPRVALAVAVAVVGAIGEVVPACQAGIRWPNDVEVEGRKLGGILVEGVTSVSGDRLIVGVGLNVGTRLDQAPAEVQRLAASLAEFGLAPDDRRVVLAAILTRLDPTLRALASGDPGLVVEWNRLDSLRNQTITIQVGDLRFDAVAEGIDPTGGLRIRRYGQVDILYAGRILRA